MAMQSEPFPAQTHSADMWIVSTCPGNVSILRPRIDRSVRRVDGIDMARELRGAHGLTPGRSVGAEEQMNEAEKLDAVMRRNLEVMGYGE